MQPPQFDGRSHGSVRHQRTSTEELRALGAWSFSLLASGLSFGTAKGADLSRPAEAPATPGEINVISPWRPKRRSAPPGIPGRHHSGIMGGLLRNHPFRDDLAHRSEMMSPTIPGCSTPRLDTQELGLQVAILLAHRRPGALHQRGLEPGGALAHAIGSALAGALVVARTHTGPGDELAFGREPAHVGADLGNDNLRTDIANAGY